MVWSYRQPHKSSFSPSCLSLPPCDFFLEDLCKTWGLKWIALLKCCLILGICCGNDNLEQFVVCHKSNNLMGGAAGEVWGWKVTAEKAGANPSGIGELLTQSSAGIWVLAGFGLSPAPCVSQASEPTAFDGGGWPCSPSACPDNCIALFVRTSDKRGCCRAGLLIHVPA